MNQRRKKILTGALVILASIYLTHLVDVYTLNTTLKRIFIFGYFLCVSFFLVRLREKFVPIFEKQTVVISALISLVLLVGCQNIFLPTMQDITLSLSAIGETDSSTGGEVWLTEVVVDGKVMTLAQTEVSNNQNWTYSGSFDDYVYYPSNGTQENQLTFELVGKNVDITFASNTWSGSVQVTSSVGNYDVIDLYSENADIDKYTYSIHTSKDYPLWLLLIYNAGLFTVLVFFGNILLQGFRKRKDNNACSKVNENLHTGRIYYLDGLRAIAAIIVLNNHAASLFFPTMFSYNEATAHFPMERLFSTTPLFGLINGEASVILFFILSGYLISNRYFSSNNKKEILVSMGMRRYFSLILPCLFSVLVGYIIVKFSLTTAHIVNPNYTFWLFDPSLKDALYQGFLGIFIGAPIPYNVVLWTIQYELPGVLLIISLLGVFGEYRKRYLVYAVAVFALLTKSFYTNLLACFIIGMFLNDLEVHGKLPRSLTSNRLVHILLLAAGVILSVYPVYTSDMLMPIANIMQALIGPESLPYRVIGVSLVFFVVINSNMIQKLLNARALVKIGEVSFCVYAIHLSIFGTVSSHLFLKLNEFLNYNSAAAITILFSYLLVYFAAVVVHRYLNLTGIKFSNYIYKKLLS